jgi:carboxypeptidase Taq
MDNIAKFREIVKKQKAYNYMLNIIGWDSQTEAPRESFARRGEMVGIISGEMFKLLTNADTIAGLTELSEKADELDDLTKRELLRAKKQLDKIIKIPENEFVAFQMLLNKAQMVWQDAKANNDFASFKDVLAEIISYNKKFAKYYAPEADIYNTLLDDFEEGMTMADYDHFFDVLKQELVPFVRRLLSQKQAPVAPFVLKHYDKEKQKEFADYLIDVMQFNRDRGLMKQSVHPFTWNTSPTDVRFTNRYIEDYFLSSIFSAIHELGHAVYEQQIDTKWDDTMLNGGVSMGIHESQSRFFENIIGRSKNFWEAHYPKLKAIFPEQLKDVTLDDFYRAINRSEASMIRVEADELTYPLHIMLRYEIERMFIQGDVNIDDLPALWNEKMTEYLGITPKNDSEGVLQDVHWSGGMIGYFPTYAFGSAISAQIYETMKKEIDVDKAVKENKLGIITDWLKAKIHQYGSSKTPKEILLEVTHEPFNPMYYVRYLKTKYSELYGIKED